MIWGYVQFGRTKSRHQSKLFMDWGLENFSRENSTFRESKQNPPPPPSFSDSIGSNNEESSSSSHGGSSKRTRLLHGAAQNQICLVDGCDSDLKNCKDYHRRHRVCDSHSKSPVVIVRGEEKRFCQQCSRFHSLGEFDEVKRSCRKRLDGHNRRRRKPQPESLIFSSRDFLSNCKGPVLLHFSDPGAYGSEIGKNLWPARTEEKMKSMVPSNSFTFGGENKQLPFFLQRNGTKQGCSPPQSFFNQQLPADAISVGSRKIPPAAAAAADTSPEDSGCALYLLSSHPVQALPDSGLSSLVESHLRVPVQNQEAELLHFSSLSDFSASFGSKDKPVCKTNIHGELVLEMEESDDALFQSEVPHQFPISWE